MSNEALADNAVATAPRLTDDPGEDFLTQVPFEALYQRLIAHACSTVELAAGDHGKAAVAALLLSLPLYDTPEGSDWEAFKRRAESGDLSLLEDTIRGFDWQEIAASLCGLFTFARHGDTRFFDPDDARAEIERLLQHFRRLVADPGVRAIVDADFEWFGDTLAAAEARWAIDTGRPVTPDTLAALAGVKTKTLANAIAARQLNTDANGQISAAEALQYLVRRKGFIRSTWQVERSVPQPQTNFDGTPTELEEQVFLPVDGDGGPFLPTLARRGRDGVPRYIIGEKSSPIYLVDFWEALSRLAVMPNPRWRRPAAGSGGWSLVSAQDGWRRFAKSDLQRMVEASRADA